MPLNPKAAEFQPSWNATRAVGREAETSFGVGFKSKSISIPLPEDPFSQECDDVRDAFVLMMVMSRCR